MNRRDSRREAFFIGLVRGGGCGPHFTAKEMQSLNLHVLKKQLPVLSTLAMQFVYRSISRSFSRLEVISFNMYNPLICLSTSKKTQFTSLTSFILISRSIFIDYQTSQA